MKITGPSGAAGAGASRAAGSASGEGFSLGAAAGVGAPAAPARMAGPDAVVNVSALLALQAVEDPTQRRRRAVRRAGRILDVLDELKLALIDGQASPEMLDRLIMTVREERGQTEDPALDGVLDEIETRAAVELAKLDRTRAA